MDGVSAGSYFTFLHIFLLCISAYFPHFYKCQTPETVTQATLNIIGINIHHITSVGLSSYFSDGVPLSLDEGWGKDGPGL